MSSSGVAGQWAGLNRSERRRPYTIQSALLGELLIAGAAFGVLRPNAAVRGQETPTAVVLSGLPASVLSGYLDTSAHWNPGTGNANPAPYAFNAGKQDGFNLNAIDFSLESAPDEGKWLAGYKAEVFLGPDAAFVNGTPAAPLRQAYVVVRAPLGNGLDLQVGRWDDLAGYEATDNVKNPNYTHSYAWSIEPTEHTGILGSYNVNEWVSAKLGGADTWTTGPVNGRAMSGSTPATAHQDNSRKTIVSRVDLTTPTNWCGLGGSSFFVSANRGYGSVTKDETYLSLGGTVNTPIRALRLGVAWDYSTHFGVNGADTGAATAINGYLLCRLSEGLGFNFRAEYARGAGLGALSDAYNGAPTQLRKVFALTGTVEYHLWKNVLSRLEARWDHAADGTDSFGGVVLGSPTKKNEITLAAEFAYLF